MALRRSAASTLLRSRLSHLRSKDYGERGLGMRGEAAREARHEQVCSPSVEECCRIVVHRAAEVNAAEVGRVNPTA